MQTLRPASFLHMAVLKGVSGDGCPGPKNHCQGWCQASDAPISGGAVSKAHALGSAWSARQEASESTNEEWWNWLDWSLEPQAINDLPWVWELLCDEKAYADAVAFLEKEVLLEEPSSEWSDSEWAAWAQSVGFGEWMEEVEDGTEAILRAKTLIMGEVEEPEAAEVSVDANAKGGVQSEAIGTAQAQVKENDRLALEAMHVEWAHVDYRFEYYGEPDSDEDINKKTKRPRKTGANQVKKPRKPVETVSDENAKIGAKKRGASSSSSRSFRGCQCAEWGACEGRSSCGCRCQER